MPTLTARLAPVVALVLVAAIVPGVATATATTGGISGRVTSESTGEPLAGVEVYVSSEDDYDSAVTDATGSYQVVGLAGGSYVTEFLPTADQPSYVGEYYDNTVDYAQATPVVVSDSVVTGVDAALTQGGTLSGTVTTADGPLAGVAVSASGAGGGYGDATTAADGSYVLRGMATDDYTVSFDAADTYVSEFYDDAATWEAAATVRVVAEQDVVGVDAYLEAGGSVSGTVTDRTDGSPLADVVVTAYDTTTGAYEYDLTAADGSYVVSGVAPGDVVVEFYDFSDQYGLQYYDDVTSEQDATRVSVRAQEETGGIDAALDPQPFGAPGQYVATDPVRVLQPTTVGAGRSTVLTVPDVPTGATAVALNITVSGVTSNTYLSACPPEVADDVCDDESVINSRGPDTANFVLLKLGGPDRDQVKLYNNAGSVNVIADLQGFMVDPWAVDGGSAADSPSLYLPVDPVRVMEPTGLQGGATTTLTLPDVPEGAAAVALNVTVAGVTGNTYLSACPPEVADDVCDDKSIINSSGPDTANFLVLKLGGAQRDQVKFYNNAGSVKVLADLQGWMVDTSSPAAAGGAMYRASDPERVLQPTKVGARGTTTLTLPRPPEGATAVALNVTVSGVTANTYVSACPPEVDTTSCAGKSIINSRGPDTANFVLLKLGGPDLDQVTFYNNAGSVNLLADLQGYMVS